MGIIFFTYQNTTKNKVFIETVTMQELKYIHISPPFTSII